MSDNQNTDDEFPVEDDFSDEPGEMAPETDMSEDAGIADEEGFSEEGDFVEEDWDSFDDESYIDDSDGDGGVAERRAAFNKILIGVVLVVVLGGGWYIMFSGETENMGQPKMDQVSGAAAVSPDQKVEFHADTKVQATDPYGVAYGEAVPTEPTEAEKPPPAAGLLNNPDVISRIRSGEQVTYEGTGADVEKAQEEQPVYRPSPQLVEGQPPMPSPITQGQDSGAGTQGLIPMPRETQAPDFDTGTPESAPARTQTTSMNTSQDPFAQMQGQENTSDVKDFDGTSTGNMQDPFATEDTGTVVRDSHDSVSSATGSSAEQTSQKLNLILDRLDRIEDDMASIEKRIDKVEKMPRASKSVTSRKTSTFSSNSTSTRSVPRQSSSANSWVLKAAQPGQAMVAKKGESDMVNIAVGETLAGIGRITGIFMQDGRWVVQGTSGKITQ